jgi:hypothetical protein
MVLKQPWQEERAQQTAGGPRCQAAAQLSKDGHRTLSRAHSRPSLALTFADITSADTQLTCQVLPLFLNTVNSQMVFL